MNAGDPLPPLREESELPPEEQTFRRNIDRVLAKGREVTRKGFSIRWPHEHRDDHRCQIINKDTKQVVGEGNNPDANTALVQAAKDYARRQAACQATTVATATETSFQG